MIAGVPREQARSAPTKAEPQAGSPEAGEGHARPAAVDASCITIAGIQPSHSQRSAGQLQAAAIRLKAMLEAATNISTACER